MLKPKVRAFLENAALELMTIKDVMTLYDRSRSGVKYHIERDNLIWRLSSDGHYLIQRDSVIALWGIPRKLVA